MEEWRYLQYTLRNYSTQTKFVHIVQAVFDLDKEKQHFEEIYFFDVVRRPYILFQALPMIAKFGIFSLTREKLELRQKTRARECCFRVSERTSSVSGKNLKTHRAFCVFFAFRAFCGIPAPSRVESELGVTQRKFPQIRQGITQMTSSARFVTTAIFPHKTLPRGTI